MSYIKVRDLKEFLNECDDDSTVILEYSGFDIEIESGDAFVRIDLDNSNIYDKCTRINFK